MDCKEDCKKNYSEEYDAYYCETCNTWLEDTCDDANCEYCTKRPPAPPHDSSH